MALLLATMLVGCSFVSVSSADFSLVTKEPCRLYTSDPLLFEERKPGRFVAAGIDPSQLPKSDRIRLDSAKDLLYKRSWKQPIEELESMIKSATTNPTTRMEANSYLLYAYKESKAWTKLKTLADKLLVDDTFALRDRVYLSLEAYYRSHGRIEEAKRFAALALRHCTEGVTSREVEQAMQLCLEHRDREALRLLVNIHPDSDFAAVSTWHCIAVLEENEGNFADAVKQYSKCIQKSDLTPRWWQLRGLSELKLEQYLDAKRDFKRALSLSFTKADKLLSLLGLAQCEIELNQLARAADDYEQALHYVEHSARYGVLMREGDLALIMRRFEIASQYYAQAKRISPASARQALFRRSRDAHILAHRYSEARVDANMLATLAPDDDENYFVRSCILTMQGKYAEAVEDVTKTINLTGSADRGLLYALRADDNYQCGKLKAAEADYRSAISNEGKQQYLVSGLSLCRAGKGTFVEQASAQVVKPGNITETSLDKLFGTKMQPLLIKELAGQIERRWRHLIEIARQLPKQ